MKTQSKKKVVKDRYLELVQCVPLRPIKSEAELDKAINMVNFLLDQLDRRSWSRDEKDYIDVLGSLIEKYESEHIIFKRSPPHKMLGHLIEAKGVTQAQAAKDCRIAESTISAVLAGSRKLTRNHIEKLSRYFHVEPGVFSIDP